MKFSIRDLLLVTVIVALAVGWAIEHRQQTEDLKLARRNSLARLQGGLRVAKFSVQPSSAPASNPPKP